MEKNHETEKWTIAMKSHILDFNTLVVETNIMKAVLRIKERKDIRGEYLLPSHMTPSEVAMEAKQSIFDEIESHKDVLVFVADEEDESESKRSLYAMIGHQTGNAAYQLIHPERHMPPGTVVKDSDRPMYADMEGYAKNRDKGIAYAIKRINGLLEFGGLTRKEGQERIFAMALDAADVSPEERESGKVLPIKSAPLVMYIVTRDPETGMKTDDSVALAVRILEEPGWYKRFSKMIDHGIVGQEIERLVTNFHYGEVESFIEYIDGLPETSDG